MATEDALGADYKVRCLEKENDRLIETVKQTRQNALALVAAVLVLTGAMLEIGEPLVRGLSDAKYDGSIQMCLMGDPQTPKRDIAVGRLTLVWNLVTLGTLACGIITIILAVRLFMRSGKYAPTFDEATPQGMTVQDYIGLLQTQYNELKKVTKSYRRPLFWAAFTALLTVIGCGFVILLWLWFGGTPESATKMIVEPLNQ